MVFKSGMFQIDPNMTPDQVANKRAMIAALLPKFGSARFVGEGIGQLATGVMAGRQGRKLDEIEGKGTASANSLWERLMGTANSAQSPDMGPLTVLGMQPEGPAMPPPDPNSPHALGDDAMAALGKPAMKTAADPASIKAGLVARGLPEHVAEGFVMNFQDESGLNPGINEAAPTVPGSRGGFGLYQLTGPRRRAYEAYAAEKGVPLDDVDAQLDFMMMELQGPEAAAWSKISGTQNAGEAGAAIVNSFLRPAEEHRASRAAKYLGGTTAAPAPTSAPSIPINELYMALQNPWLSGEQKGLITSMIQEQQQASDPLRQLELQKAQLELEKLQAPAAPPEELTTRMMLAEQAGLEQGTPEYQTYLLTGELPPPPKGTPAPMTPEQRKMWGIPDTDTSAYFLNEKGEPEKVGGGGVTVNNNMGEDKFAEAFAKGDADTLKAIGDTGLAAARNIGRIDQLASILQQTPTGMAASWQQWAGELGVNTEGLDEIQTAQAIINSLVPEQRQPGSGPMSDADLALFKESLPRIINQPGGNEMIVGTMRAIAEYDAEGANIVQRLRNGELTRAEAFDSLKNRPNPLAGFKPPAGASEAAAPDADGWTTLPNGVKVRVKQ